MKRAVHIPDIGDFHDVEVIEVVAKPGDTLAAEAPLVTLESDKAAMDVPAPFAGKVLAVHIKAGDKVNQGDLVADMEIGTDADTADSAAAAAADAQTSADPSPDPKPESEKNPDASQAETTPPPEESPPQKTPTHPVPTPAPSSPTPSPVPSPVATDDSHPPHAGPGVRRFARELGVDLRRVSGTGPKGRILKTDVESHVKSVMTSGAASVPASGFAFPEVPPVDFSQFGEVEVRPLARVRKLSGANLRRNWIVAPHVTQHEEADVTDMDAFRKSLADEAKRAGYRMTPLAFLVKAAALALREFPEFNASLDPSGENLVVKKYCNIGVAVDTPQGLVVPVIRDAHGKGVRDFASELAEVSARAREGKLKREDMQGGCFTISSLGGIGGTAFSPIINLPEVAILGVARAQTKPQWDGEKFVPRLMMPLSLSYDHRVIDGAQGARFIVRLRELLSDIRRLAL